MKILITGGSGLVGYGLKQVIFNSNSDGNEYIFLSSKDCDLANL
jgi:dTDP-4-dehydrorhamnose reductase